MIARTAVSFAQLLCLATVLVVALPASSQSTILVAVRTPEVPPATWPDAAFVSVSLTEAINYLYENVSILAEKKLILSPGIFYINQISLNSLLNKLIIEGSSEKNTTLRCSPSAAFAFAVSGMTDVQIRNLNIRECWPSAAIIISTSTNVILSNLTIEDNGFVGGGIEIARGRNVSIIDAVFRGNQALRGGAINISDSEQISIQRCTFANNTAFLSGGAIYAKNSEFLAFSASKFRSNQVRGTNSIGGAIHIVGGRTDLQDLEFDANFAAAHGGALAASSSALITIHNSTFLNNGAAFRGGALCANDSSILDPIKNCVFQNNSASFGGAIALSTTISTIYNSSIQFNRASRHGGGLWTESSTKLELSNSLVASNLALVGGIQVGCRNSCLWSDPTSTICSGTDFEPYTFSNDSMFFSALYASTRGLLCDDCIVMDSTRNSCVLPLRNATCKASFRGVCSWRPVSSALLSDSRPEPRSNYVLVPWKDGFVIHGGGSHNSSVGAATFGVIASISNAAATTYGDTWYFDIKTKKWSLLHAGSVSGAETAAPTPRWKHAGTLIDESTLLIHGGSCSSLTPGCQGGSTLSDVWSFNLENRLWTRWNTTMMSGAWNSVSRLGHSMWKFGSSVIIYGGSLIDRGVWELDLLENQWRSVEINHQTSSEQPRFRTGHAHALISNDSAVLISGEVFFSSYSCFIQDVWQWNRTQNSWSPLSQANFPWDRVNQRWAPLNYGPDSRAGHVIVHLPEYNSVWLFGGEDAVGFKGNVWEFSLTSRCWTRRADRFDTMLGPKSRSGFSAVLFQDQIYMFGGYSEDLEARNDIWMFDLRLAGYGDNATGTCGSTSPGPFTAVGVIFGGLWLIIFGVWFICRTRKQPNQDPDDDVAESGDGRIRTRAERLRPRWNKPNFYLVPKQDRDFTSLFLRQNSKKPTGKRQRETKQDSDRGTDSGARSSSSSSLGPIDRSMPNINYFDDLPDEAIIRIMSVLQGPDLASMIACDSRFRLLGNDSEVWKRVVSDYWTETEEFKRLKRQAHNFSYKDFFLHGAQAFKRSRREGKLRAAVSHAHSTAFFYPVIFAMALQAFLAGLKIDGAGAVASIPWIVVFLPTLLVGLVGLILCFLATMLRCKYRIGKAALEGLAPRMQLTVRTVSRPARLGFLWVVALAFFLTPILLSARIDIANASLSWWVALAPLFALLLSIAFIPARLLCSRRVSFVWLAAGLPLFLLINLVLAAAKLESLIQLDWCYLFVPWWISEIFLLCAAVGFCLFANKAVVGWVLSICCTVYIACMVILRTLLCANLGSRDGCFVGGQPLSFPATIVFIPIYIVLLISFNGIVFVSKHIPTPDNSAATDDENDDEDDDNRVSEEEQDQENDENGANRSDVEHDDQIEVDDLGFVRR